MANRIRELKREGLSLRGIAASLGITKEQVVAGVDPSGGGLPEGGDVGDVVTNTAPGEGGWALMHAAFGSGTKSGVAAASGYVDVGLGATGVVPDDLGAFARADVDGFDRLVVQGDGLYLITYTALMSYDSGAEALDGIVTIDTDNAYHLTAASARGVGSASLVVPVVFTAGEQCRFRVNNKETDPERVGGFDFAWSIVRLSAVATAEAVLGSGFPELPET